LTVGVPSPESGRNVDALAACQEPALPARLIRPCQPTLSSAIPTGPGWTHEIKYDGYRLIARKDGSDDHGSPIGKKLFKLS